MGSVRGRAVLDFLRHRVGWSATGAFDTKDFWDASYAKRGMGAHEWALAPGTWPRGARRGRRA